MLLDPGISQNNLSITLLSSHHTTVCLKGDFNAFYKIVGHLLFFVNSILVKMDLSPDCLVRNRSGHVMFNILLSSSLG